MSLSLPGSFSRPVLKPQPRGERQRAPGAFPARTHLHPSTHPCTPSSSLDESHEHPLNIHDLITGSPTYRSYNPNLSMPATIRQDHTPRTRTHPHTGPARHVSKAVHSPTGARLNSRPSDSFGGLRLRAECRPTRAAGTRQSTLHTSLPSPDRAGSTRSRTNQRRHPTPATSAAPGASSP